MKQINEILNMTLDPTMAFYMIHLIYKYPCYFYWPKTKWFLGIKQSTNDLQLLLPIYCELCALLFSYVVHNEFIVFVCLIL